eukprot:TRINITY_DN2821_c0_g1_i2.p1 TRINITY_DN2821_c0_g1~~TRINITY_DN2821_c0_g1_i2.p1  ORF type:complete len:229 (+),score=24.97 TRINITY_DN2821_c0_g1_i2:477-1163(+)
MLWLVFLFGILGGLSIILISYSIAMILDYQGYLFQCTIGFSGVLFSLVTIETQFNPVNYSLWGMASVPAKYYPWILLIIAQFLMSGVSFIGHLSGILIGYAYAFGWLKWLVPSADFFIKIESSRLLVFFVKLSGYITHPSLGRLPTTMETRGTPSDNNDNPGILSRLRSNLSPAANASAYQPFSGVGHTLGSSIPLPNNNNIININNNTTLSPQKSPIQTKTPTEPRT